MNFAGSGGAMAADLRQARVNSTLPIRSGLRQVAGNDDFAEQTVTAGKHLGFHQPK
jgi:hypothetical protein